MDVPNGTDFRHDPRPSDVPFFGERRKIWTSHTAATPGQPVYRVSVVKLTRAQQDEFKKSPDQTWAKIVRIEDGRPTSDFKYQCDLTLPGGEGREFTFPVVKDLYAEVNPFTTNSRDAYPGRTFSRICACMTMPLHAQASSIIAYGDDSCVMLLG